MISEKQLAIYALHEKLKDLTLTAIDRAVLMMELEKLINK